MWDKKDLLMNYLPLFEMHLDSADLFYYECVHGKEEKFLEQRITSSNNRQIKYELLLSELPILKKETGK